MSTEWQKAKIKRDKVLKLKLISDIYCAEDMEMIAIKFNPKTITNGEKERLKALSEKMNDTRSNWISFCSFEMYFRLAYSDPDMPLVTERYKYDGITEIPISDFLSDRGILYS